MYRRLWTVCLGLGVLVMTMAGCEAQLPATPSGLEVGSGATLPTVGIGATLPTGGVPAQMGPRPRPSTWVDTELFAGVVTPATFNPESDPFDELYTAGGPNCSGDPDDPDEFVGFKNGVPLISESKPGDRDYNGGRWHLNIISGVDCDKYDDADSVDVLDLGDFMPTAIYFECPLLPRRGNN